MVNVSQPSATAVALIVGMGVSTWVAIMSTVGYFARKFLTQQASNHADTLEALEIARDIQYRLPKLHRRVRKLEQAGKRHRAMHRRIEDGTH